MMKTIAIVSRLLFSRKIRGAATFDFLQHGVIPGSSQTKAQGISSPGPHEANLMWPRNDGERQWNIMLDWTCR
jgi:hypothetical protein